MFPSENATKAGGTDPGRKKENVREENEERS